MELPAMNNRTALLLGALLASPAAACPKGQIEATVTRVIDGDTIEIGNGLRIRLAGLAAPEHDHKARPDPDVAGRVWWPITSPRGDHWGGPEATAAMRAMVMGKTLHCNLTGESSYNRCVGTCETQDGSDISEAMISGGWARTCPKFAGENRERYAEAEDRAATGGAKITMFYQVPRYCKVKR
jgi:endonuclease YncB( thermonuclease family)